MLVVFLNCCSNEFTTEHVNFGLDNVFKLICSLLFKLIMLIF